MEKHWYSKNTYALDIAPNGSSHLGKRCHIFIESEAYIEDGVCQLINTIGKTIDSHFNTKKKHFVNAVLVYEDKMARELSSRIIKEKENGDVELYSPWQHNSYYLRLTTRK